MNLGLGIFIIEKKEEHYCIIYFARLGSFFGNFSLKNETTYKSPPSLRRPK